ncbi:MAG: TetR family transcriptional regulator [Sphingomonadaceae bacterium]|nr:TetR family transcriptional regulator [Sphingomonadaceae bacterium]
MSAERRYGGQSQEARIAERREKLMRAALALYGRVGPADASVAMICAEAGLTARYFYESFANRDALFLAVFEAVCARLLEGVRERANGDGGAALGALFTALAEHPGLARMFVVDLHHDSDEIRAVAKHFGVALAALIAPGVDDPLLRAGVMGATMRIARAWIEADYAAPIETVAAAAARFTLAARSA